MTAGDVVVPNDKTGTLWTAIGHIFCAVVGAGVLGLPNSVAWLGWVAGPICLCCFFAVSLWSSHLLAQLYRIENIEFSRYHHLVQHVLGRSGSIAIATFQMLNLVLTCIAYSITGAVAMRTIADYLGTKPDREWQLVMVMGAIELVFSQIPSLEEIWWVSALGTISSLGYVFISLGLGLAYSGNREGSVGGRPGTSTANKIFSIFNSLGNIAFAFGFAQVLLEIQDTLRQPPSAIGTMRKASSVAVTAAFAFYFSTSVACYSAQGNDVKNEVLEGFEMAPDWVLILANIFIVIHMVTAWQVWAQPVFETIESNIKAWIIRRQLAAVGGAAAAADAPGGKGLEDAAGTKASPFDAPAEGHHGHAHGHHHHHHLHILPAVVEAESDVEDGAQALPSHSSLGALSQRMSSALRSRCVSVRGSGSFSVVNTAPHPDLLPPGGWKRKHGSTTSLRSMDTAGSGASYAAAGVQQSAHSATGVQRSGASATGVHASGLSVTSRISSITSVLGQGAMYHLDTALANEHVPANDQGFYLPFWQRLLIRSTYVLLCTLVAACMPFFSAIVGLVGAITYWPLSVGAPFLMYTLVKKPTGWVVSLMKAVAVVMFVVAIVAIIGSVQSLIVSLSNTTFFG